MGALKKVVVLAVLCGLVQACAPKVGSPEWCDKMDTTTKGDWTMNDATEYAKNCVFRKPK
jgi:hypothetical protein